MRPEKHRPASPEANSRELVERFGGRFSKELGIDLDRGEHQVKRWFLAATLFGTRIPASIVLRTYQTMAAAGVRTIEDAGLHTWSELVDLLDRGGYVRYDFKTASRLLELSAAVNARHPRGLKALSSLEPDRLQAELDALPGWGPVTIRLFLRELRGIWPGADLPMDPRALSGARHLGLRPPRRGELAWLRRQARTCRVDLRDLEAALVRASLSGRRRVEPKTTRPLSQGSHSGRRSGLGSGRTARSQPARDRLA